MKIVLGFLALMFLSFAAVQYNDPDPLLWILIYLSVTVLCVLAIFKKFYPLVMGALATGFIIYASLLSPGVYDWFMSEDRSLLFDDLAKMQYYYIEEAREFLGLMICLATLVFLFIRSRRTAQA